MLYPATWGEVVSRFQAGREAMLVGSGAGVEALAQYLALAASGGGCQNISYGGVPIYTCPPGGASIPRGYVVTDGATARRVQERLRGLPNPGALKVVPVGGERDSPELHRVILGLPLLWIGETPYLFAPGY
ncbi:MAG: hypothetical protein NZ846_11850, partial [Thermus sp.]|nr:hypothetical protein [Thermus sp.]